MRNAGFLPFHSFACRGATSLPAGENVVGRGQRPLAEAVATMRDEREALGQIKPARNTFIEPSMLIRSLLNDSSCAFGKVKLARVSQSLTLCTIHLARSPASALAK